jgi:hypothetical protein
MCCGLLQRQYACLLVCSTARPRAAVLGQRAPAVEPCACGSDAPPRPSSREWLATGWLARLHVYPNTRTGRACAGGVYGASYVELLACAGGMQASHVHRYGCSIHCNPSLPHGLDLLGTAQLPATVGVIQLTVNMDVLCARIRAVKQPCRELWSHVIWHQRSVTRASAHSSDECAAGCVGDPGDCRQHPSVPCWHLSAAAQPPRTVRKRQEDSSSCRGGQRTAGGGPWACVGAPVGSRSDVRAALVQTHWACLSYAERACRPVCGIGKGWQGERGAGCVGWHGCGLFRSTFGLRSLGPFKQLAGGRCTTRVHVLSSWLHALWGPTGAIQGWYWPAPAAVVTTLPADAGLFSTLWWYLRLLDSGAYPEGGGCC